ncbi:MAG: hypothetical protein GC165_08050 [Armatimonadetes bacterium]|nr:hypothetical protein [Armatimonadota bacterium]
MLAIVGLSLVGCRPTYSVRDIHGAWTGDKQAPGYDSMLIFATDGTYSLSYHQDKDNYRYMGTFQVKGDQIQLQQQRVVHGKDDHQEAKSWSSQLVWLSDDHIELYTDGHSEKYTRFVPKNGKSPTL